jgi:hypothetical protein
MLRQLSRFVIGGSLLFGLSLVATAEEFLCQNNAGCSAVLDTPQGRTRVTFHHGDVISTDGGWIVESGNGWTSLTQAK